MMVATGSGASRLPSRRPLKVPNSKNAITTEAAVKGNIVPDFPLINKSFNLSYAGNDL